MHAVLRHTWWWVPLNVVGMAVYLWLASALWVWPGDVGMPGGPGDAFYWLFVVVPVLLAFVIANALALMLAWRRTSGRLRHIMVAMWLAIALAWAVTVVFDHYKSYRVINAENA
jgi:hypothetical protein